jgi:hypothetical protein
MHIAYTALHEKPDLVAGWSSKEQIETNNAMLRNVVEPVVRTASNFQHISILRETKIYGVHRHRIPTPARERDARKDHPDFFDQEAMCVRWEPGTASTTRHRVRSSSPGRTPGTLECSPRPSVSTRQSAVRMVNRSVFLAVRRSSGRPLMQTSSPR